MKLTATQTKVIAKVREMLAASEDGRVDVTYIVKGLNNNSKSALIKAGVLVVEYGTRIEGEGIYQNERRTCHIVGINL